MSLKDLMFSYLKSVFNIDLAFFLQCFCDIFQVFIKTAIKRIKREVQLERKYDTYISFMFKAVLIIRTASNGLLGFRNQNFKFDFTNNTI